MLPEEGIQTNKEKIIKLLRSTQREGIENVINYLNNYGFFEMPSSLPAFKRHHNWKGGLAQHCLGVCDRLQKTGETLPLDSVIITSLLHDICKVRVIRKDAARNWYERPQAELHFPGHGNRSVKILQHLGLKLTKDEEASIRWHMGGWKIKERSKDEIRYFFATKKSDLWRLLYNADKYDASHHPGI